MRYTERKPGEDPLFEQAAPVVKGLGLSLVELSVSRRRGHSSVRLTVYKKDGAVGVDDCARVHRAVLPRLELALPGEDLYVEVTSPGIDRVIRDGAEFVHYIGRGIRCYRSDLSDWSAGILESAGNEGIVLRGKKETMNLSYGIIAKAQLSYQEEA
ncbi:MAG: ribosome assembly cofactor RimP [Treponema sp.]|jgi:ribosome maturation factor RimP|nr:ribosome assembly cofactor RimP [Treponema sp.]